MSRSIPFEVNLQLDDPDDPNMMLVVYGTAIPHDPGVTSGPVEACYPPEGGEVEIDAVWLHYSTRRAVEITPIVMLLSAGDKLQELTEQALANQPVDDEPAHPEDYAP